MADDPELEAIRQQRMAQMQQQMGGGAGGGEKQAEMRQQQQQMKNSMLNQILDQNARARLNTIGMVNPSKQEQIEGMLVQMARTGQIGGRLSEAGLVSLLEKINSSVAQAAGSKVKFDRRRAALDSSDEDD